jgi:hypothetical protein
MANEPAFEPATAPRDIEALKAATPFKLKFLATALGAFATAEKQSAWHQLPNKEAQAQCVLALLKEWDAKHANGTNGTAAPTAIVPVSASQVAAVSPGATAAATAAAADKAKGSVKRQPVPQAGAGPAPAGNVDLGAAVLEELAGIRAQVATLAQAVNHLSVTTTSKDGKLMEALQALMTSNDKLTQLQTWQFITLLTFAENQMNVTPLDLLRSAVTDANVLETLVDQVRQELGAGK